jgi:uncharacterized membrane protein YfhO
MILDYFEKKPLGFLFAAVTFIVVVIFFNFLTNSFLYLYTDIGSDTASGFFPNFYGYVTYFGMYGIPTWTFTEGMGSNVFPAVFSNPMHILFFLFQPNAIPYVILFLAILKLYITAYFFFRYFRLLNLSAFASIVGSLLLTFSGFMILGGTWYLFSAEGMQFAIFLFGIESFIKKRNVTAFVIAVALTAAQQPFNLFLISLFAVLYLTIRIIGDEQKSFKELSLLFGKFILLGALGIGLSFVLFYANFNRVMESPRVSGEASYTESLSQKPIFEIASAVELQTTVYRLLSSDMAGAGNKYTGYINYLEGPMGYVGLLSLLLLAHTFKYLTKRQKIFFIIIFSIWLISSLLPYFRYAFWLFNGDYYRTYSFYFSFFIVFYAIKSLDIIFRNEKADFKPLIISAVIILAMALFNFEPKVIANESMQILVLTFVIFYIAVFFLMKEKSIIQHLPKALLVLLTLELAVFSYMTINDRGLLTIEQYTSKTGYFDYTNEALDKIKSRDKSFFRIDKDYHSAWSKHISFLDAMAQNYFGTETYNNFNQKYYVNFLAGMKVFDPKNEFATRWSIGLKQRFYLQMMANTRYRLCKSNWIEHQMFGAELIDSVDKIKVYEYKNFVPFGSSYDSFITESEFAKLSIIHSDVMTLRAIVIADSLSQLYYDYKQLKHSDTLELYMPDDIANYTNAIGSEHLQMKNFTQKLIEGTITLSADKIMLITTPFDKGWKLEVNGEPHEILIVNHGLIGIKLPKGSHDIKLEYGLRNFGFTLIISGISALLLIALILYKRRRKAVPKR